MKHEKRLTLNARKMDTRERAHEHLKRRLRLPAWYGDNLDALSDCLGEIGEPTTIVVGSRRNWHICLATMERG